MVIKRVILAILFVPASSLATATDVIFTETFDQPQSVIEQRWNLSSATIVPDNGGKSLLVESRSYRRVLPSTYVRVTTGKRYTVTGRLKLENVSAERSGLRGATLFAEHVDRNRAHVPGGTYPRGLTGTSDWQVFSIPVTERIPEGVEYIKLYLALEGRGKVWFDDVTVREFEDWKPVALLSPEHDTDLMIQRPVLRWESRGRPWLIELSSDETFSPAKTHSYFVGERDEFLLPFFLGAGSKWYWRVRDASSIRDVNEFYGSDNGMIQVSPESLKWPPLIESRFEWSSSPTPELVCHVDGDFSSIKAKIDGEEALVKVSDGGIVTLVPGSAIDPGLHEVDLSVFGENGEVFTEVFVYNNTIPGSKVTFDGGITYIDGEAFFPIGAYRDPSDNYRQFDGLVEAGFNVTHSYVFTGRSTDKSRVSDIAAEYLELADAHGLKVFLGIPREWVVGLDEAELVAYTARHMQSPALLSWYVFDEPERLRVPIPVIARTSEIIKNIDPFHPTQIVCNNLSNTGSVMQAWSETVDIFSIDPYPGEKRQPFSMIWDWAMNCRKLVGEDRPVWVTLEAFDVDFWRGGPYFRKVDEHGPVVRPTYEELRCMTYLALSGGADGIFYYWLPRWAYDIREDAPDVWVSISAMVEELTLLTPWMTTPRPEVDSFSLQLPEPFKYWTRVDGAGNRILAIINSSPKVAMLNYELNAKQRAIFLEMGNDGIDVLSESFGPYEVKLYGISP